jgi:hypothetical protein
MSARSGVIDMRAICAFALCSSSLRRPAGDFPGSNFPATRQPRQHHEFTYSSRGPIKAWKIYSHLQFMWCAILGLNQ